MRFTNNPSPNLGWIKSNYWIMSIPNPYRIQVRIRFRIWGADRARSQNLVLVLLQIWTWNRIQIRGVESNSRILMEPTSWFWSNRFQVWFKLIHVPLQLSKKIQDIELRDKVIDTEYKMWVAKFSIWIINQRFEVRGKY